MNFKKFAAVFRNCTVVYEIINNHLYLKTPNASYVVANISTLPRALENLATEEKNVGETKASILRYGKRIWHYAQNTGITYRSANGSTPNVILQGLDPMTRTAYPVFVDQDHFDLAPANPESIMTCGRDGPVMITGDGSVCFITPICVQKETLADLLDDVQRICLSADPDST